MTITSLLKGFKFYFVTASIYTKKTLPIFILLGLLAASGDILLNNEILFTWGILILIFTNLFLTPFLTAFSILLVNDLEKNSLKETLGYYLVSFQLSLKVLMLTLSVALIVILGLLFFILPGIYFASRLLYSPFYLIIDGKSIVQSMDSSWKSTANNTTNYLTVLFLYWTALIVVTFLVLTIISAFVINTESMSLPFVLNSLANGFLSYFQLVFVSYPLLFIYKNKDHQFSN